MLLLIDIASRIIIKKKTYSWRAEGWVRGGGSGRGQTGGGRQSFPREKWWRWTPGGTRVRRDGWDKDGDSRQPRRGLDKEDELWWTWGELNGAAEVSVKDRERSVHFQLPELSVAPLSRLWSTPAVPGNCRRPNPQPGPRCCVCRFTDSAFLF